MSDVVTALSYLWEEPETEPSLSDATPSSRMTTNSDIHQSEIMAQEREKEVAEAIAWGSRSRDNNTL